MDEDERKRIVVSYLKTTSNHNCPNWSGFGITLYLI